MSDRPSSTCARALSSLVKDAGVTPGVFLDAFRTYVLLRLARDETEKKMKRALSEWCISMTPIIDAARVVPGRRRDFTYPDAVKVVGSVLPVTDDHVGVHLVRHYLDEDEGAGVPLVDRLTNEFLALCALVVVGGWDETYQWEWWIRGRHPSLLLAAEWLARFDIESLNVCVLARYSEAELAQVIDDGRLPDPEQVGLLAGLLSRADRM